MIISLVHGAKETTMIKDLKREVASEMIVKIETGIVLAIEGEVKIETGTEVAVLDPVAIMVILIGNVDKIQNVSVQLSIEHDKIHQQICFIFEFFISLIIII